MDGSNKPPGRITTRQILPLGSGGGRAHAPPTSIPPPPIKRIHLSAKPADGKTRKRQRLSGATVVEIGKDVRLVVLSGDAEVLIEAPRSVWVSDAQRCEIS